jgi:hypothetical protein
MTMLVVIFMRFPQTGPTFLSRSVLVLGLEFGCQSIWPYRWTLSGFQGFRERRYLIVLTLEVKTYFLQQNVSLKA